MPTEKTAVLTKSTSGKATGMFKTFKVKMVSDSFGFEEKFVEFHTDSLVDFLRSNLQIEEFYNNIPVVSVIELFSQIENIKHVSRHYDRAITSELIKFLESENKTIVERAKNL
jgi:hypothetical protein